MTTKELTILTEQLTKRVEDLERLVRARNQSPVDAAIDALKAKGRDYSEFSWGTPTKINSEPQCHFEIKAR